MRRRCGWCGAYEGTVDPDEPCDGTVTTGPDGEPMLGGPHQFTEDEMHHAPRRDPEMDQELGDEMEELEADVEGVPGEPRGIMGATGRHPDGKLTERDEGELRFRVGYARGHVVMDMGELGWVGMTPAGAKELAKKLLKYANPVTRP